MLKVYILKITAKATAKRAKKDKYFPVCCGYKCLLNI